MLVVESDSPGVKRIKAPELLVEMEKLRNSCSDEEYCLTSCPHQISFEKQKPVEALINNKAKRSIKAHKMDEKLKPYTGHTRTTNVHSTALGSLRPER
jgi:hypothetical protein